jgi:hypothetical protein
MPERSKILLLPPEIKAELDRRLIAGSFSNYEEQTNWLNGQLREAGLEITISRAAIHRYGQGFEDKCEAIKIATEQAKAIVGVVGDDQGSMDEALIRLIQQLSFDILVKSKDGDLGDILPKMGVMVAKLSKASVDIKKYAVNVRKETLNEAADAVETAAKREGVSKETRDRIRRDVLMMAT